MAELMGHQGIYLTYREALSLHSAIRQSRRKDERSAAKKPFTPAPGRANATLISIARKTELEERLMELIETYPQYDPEEWADDE